MTVIPAAFPALMPFTVSSMTQHFSGGTPKRLVERRNISGEGLGSGTSSELVTSLK